MIFPKDTLPQSRLRRGGSGPHAVEAIAVSAGIVPCWRHVMYGQAGYSVMIWPVLMLSSAASTMRRLATASDMCAVRSRSS
jgi:hypothetical protein